MRLEESDIGRLRPARVFPGGALGRFVSEISVRVRNAATSDYLGLPHVQPDLVFRLLDDGGSRSEPRFSRGELAAVGTLGQAFRISVASVAATLIVRFRPGGAAPFFRVPMRDLADRVVPIEALWGRRGSELRERLLEQPDSDRWLKLVQEYLKAQIQSFDGSDPRSVSAASAAVRTIFGLPEIPPVTVVASNLDLSERQLRRVFDDAVGLGPKAFARIVRFHRALRAADCAGAADWADVAVSAGYFDQAHLIAECRRFTDMTPKAFLHTWKNAGDQRDRPL